jgi:hypothetical protein
MSHHEEPTSSGWLEPETWESYAVFRETFLVLLPPAEREAYRLLGRRLYLDRNEAVLPDDLASGESAVVRELRAAVGDLAILAGYLGAVGQDLELGPEDKSLHRLAQECGAVLCLLAHRILGRLPAPCPSLEEA